MTTFEHYAELKRLHDSGFRHARQSWNLACTPNWGRINQQALAFREAFKAEWNRLSVDGRHRPGCNCYGQRFMVDIETGNAS